MRLAEPLDRLDRILRRVDFGALAAAPEHVGPRAQLHAEVHRAHRLLQRVGADARRRCEVNAPSLNTGSVNRFVVAIGTPMPVSVQRLLEVADDAVALGGRRVDRARDRCRGSSRPRRRARRAAGRRRRGSSRGANELAERIAAAIADGPEAERELVRSYRFEGIGLHAPMIVSGQAILPQSPTFLAATPL